MPGKGKHTAEFDSCVKGVMKGGKDESSAYAICTTQFKESDKPIFEAATRHLLLRGALGKSRVEKWQGKDHLVVPIIALVEGVIHAVNSENPEYIDRSVLEKAQDSWNGMPVTLGHPTRNGKPVSANEPAILESHAFGIIRNAEIKGDKLEMEALIDIARLEELDADLLADLQAGEVVEVSVGALVRTSAAEGTHKKKKYKGKWLEIYGDHLAMLPGGVGACSAEMGCGANRAACVHLVTAEGLVPVTEVGGLPYFAFTNLEGESFEERMRAVEMAVRKKWPPSDVNDMYGSGAWPMQMYDDHVIVNVYNKTGSELMWCDYTTDDDGVVTLGEPKKVKQVYVAAIGKRHSQKDVEIIQGVHDHAMALGAQCDAANCMKPADHTPIKQTHEKRIRMDGGKWKVYSTDGKHCLGQHDNEVAAVEHLKAIDRARQRRSLELAGAKS